jgi:hypothetical protein
MASGGLREKCNFKGLNLPTFPSSEDGASQLTIHSRLNLPADSETDKSAHASLTSTLRNLDINNKAGPGGERKFDLKNEAEDDSGAGAGEWGQCGQGGAYTYRNDYGQEGGC